MVAKIGSKAFSSSGRPATLVKIWTPPAPSSFTARRASCTEPSTSVIDNAATKVGNRAGWRAHNSAIASLPMRARFKAASPAARSSIGGFGNEMISR